MRDRPMPPEFEQTIPILRIFDVAKAKEFHVGFLGFTVDWEHHFGENAPAYLQVSRAGLTLHLSEHHGDACPGSTVFVWMTGIEEFHREICACVGRLANTLKPEYAEVLRAVDVEETPVKAFAEAAGLTASNAGVRLFRAREALRKEVTASCGTCAEHGCLDCSCGSHRATH